MKIGDLDMSDLAKVAAMHQMRPNVHYAAALNIERVRGYLETHLGCTVREAAYALDLSYDQAARSVRRLRAEWVGK